MRLLIVIAAVVALYWSIRILAKSSPQFAQKFLRNLLIVAAVALFLFMLATGRLNWLGVLLLALIPLLRKVAYLGQWLPWLRRVSGNAQSGPTANSQGERVSSVSARFLIMRLNQGSGEIDGDIVEGQFKGRRLSQMSLPDLLQFNTEVASDADSSALLQAYLDRIYPDWRQKTTQSQRNSFSDSEMSMAQALEILGLPDNPTREEVIKAHRRLMQKLHPDQGGSTYLAAKVNLAKKYLLDHLYPT